MNKRRFFKVASLSVNALVAEIKARFAGSGSFSEIGALSLDALFAEDKGADKGKGEVIDRMVRYGLTWGIISDYIGVSEQRAKRLHKKYLNLDKAEEEHKNRRLGEAMANRAQGREEGIAENVIHFIDVGVSWEMTADFCGISVKRAKKLYELYKEADNA